MPLPKDHRVLAVVALFISSVLLSAELLQAQLPQSSPASNQHVPPPPFHVFKARLSDEMVSMVVSSHATDAQLRSLLWLIREKIRARKFADLGLSEKWGIAGGVIDIYRGERCANEQFSTSGLGPCGYGEHESALFEWGIHGDPNSDWATLGNVYEGEVVFDSSKDHWEPGQHHH